MAHAELVGTSPAAREQLPGSPTEVRLWFTEDVSPAGPGIEVFDAAGQQVELDDVGSSDDRTVIRAGLPSALSNGTYAVVWSVVSADGHTIRGSFAFSVGEPLEGGITAPSVPGTPRWVEIAAASARSIAYVVALTVIGALAFVVSLRDAVVRVRRLALAAALLLAVAAPLMLAAEGLVTTTGDLGDLWTRDTADVLREGRHLPAAGIIVTGVAAALGALTVCRGHRVAGRVLAIVAAGVIALGFAWSGHPAAADPRWQGIGLNTVHVVATGVWAGGLVVVLVEGRTPDQNQMARIARRFSQFATIAFPLAVASGALLALRILPEPSALVSTDYGRLLIAKVALLVVATTFAWWNRRRLLPHLAAATSRVPTFRKLVAVEAGLAALAIVVTATMVGQSPRPPAEGNVGADPPLLFVAPSMVETEVGAYHIGVALSPARQGENRITVEFHGFETGALPAPRS
ncbi:MAG: copper resistance protein CopC/CopD, partial [Phycisphaeraceae bacterium]|nr:copper resistance protein CopC/CopD [Phycisphaeraceae bacterium]